MTRERRRNKWPEDAAGFVSRVDLAMATARESIEIYLRHKEVAEDRQLAVAIFFAESMLLELGAAVAEWQEAASRLHRLKGDTTPPCRN